MKWTAALTLLAMLSLTACGTSGPASDQAFCTAAHPIYFDKADKVTKRTEAAIIALNEKGERLCGWKAPGK